MDINCIIQSTENLCISDDDVKNTANYLLGDEFEKSWDTNKLSLPPKASPLFCYKRRYARTVHSPQMSYKRELENRLSVRATLKLKSGKTLDYLPGDSISILPENNAQTVAWLLQRLTLDSLHDADTLFTHEVIATKHRSLPEWSHFTSPLSLRYLLTYCCELYIPVTRRILRLLADYCFDDNVSPVSAERQRNRLLEFSSAEGKKMFEKYIQIPDLNLLDILSIFSCCRPSFIRLLEILPTLQPRSYTLINPVDKQLSCEQELSFIFTRVDFKYPESDKHVGLIDRYPSRRHGTCTGWLEKIWFGVNQPDDYQKSNATSRSLVEANEQLRMSRAEIETLSTEISRIRDALSRSETEKANVQRENNTQRLDNDQLRAQLDDFEVELEQIKEQLEDERENNRNINEILTITRQKEQKALSEAQERTTEVIALRDRIASAEERAEMAQREVEKVRERLAETEREANRLSRSLSAERFEKERALSELRLSSLPAGYRPSGYSSLGATYYPGTSVSRDRTAYQERDDY
ncbi:unnamed protein product [Schistosoma mattheei]|uniref:Uncharacterized protein n=1 Tax=Schistosoma mattheei TaxID=31246 RepID=A0A183PA58_9TREM|nr:unnamed protein product [Schistosoma mattheei]